MMALSYRGVRELDWRLRLLVARVRSDLPAATQQIGQTMAEDARRRIGHYQLGWLPLAEVTRAEKTKLGISPPDRPLYRSGAMQRSVRSENGAMVATVVVDPPGLWQERGTTRKTPGTPGYRPPRPFIRPALIEMLPVARSLLAETLRVAIEES